MQKKETQAEWWTRYHLYLKSKEWKAKREAYFKKYGKECKVCGSIQNIELDHLDYKRMGNELLTDLLGLCRVHHQEITKVRKQKKVTSGIGYRKVTEEHFGIKLPVSSVRSTKTKNKTKAPKSWLKKVFRRRA